LNIVDKFNLDIPLSIDKIIRYNKDSEKVIKYNRQDIKLLIDELNMELKEIKYPNIREIRKYLKKKSKKFILSKDYNIGNLVSFGANIDDEKDSYKLIMMPYIGNNKAEIMFKYYPRSKLFKTMFNRLSMSLRTDKVKVNREIIKTKSGNYIKYSTIDEKYNTKFWYIVRLWAKI
jgi:hypothetical protein